MDVRYLHLKADGSLPQIQIAKPFMAIIVGATAVSSDWRDEVSRWLVKNGCLYVLAWGIDCSAWDDSVDHASLEVFDFGEIPEKSLVMTTWHDDESLKDVFSFAQHAAHHPTENIETAVIVDIHERARSATLLGDFAAAAEPAVRRSE